MTSIGFRRWYTLLALSAVACGSVAKGLRPADRSATGEMEPAGACHAVGVYAEPLVVDWPSHQRADLVESMHDGVAVVSYDCHKLRLLRGCNVEGSYSFLPVPRDDQVLKLLDVEELRANLPAGFLAAEIGGEIARGSNLDVATVLVGKTRTTVREVTREKLRGGSACDGATHFLRGAYVGAFATSMQTEGKVQTTVSVFASASAKSSKTSEHRAGRLAACDQLSKGSATPDCDAVMRLELVALDQSTVKTAAMDEGFGFQVSSVLSPCPEGLVYRQSKCVRPGLAAHLCRSNDAADCKAQCRAGDAPSCNNLAVMHLNAKGVPEDRLMAAALFKQACEGHVAMACRNLGMLYAEGKGVQKDPALAVKFYERSCTGNDMSGCTWLAHVTFIGEGVASNPQRSGELFKLACDGGSPMACSELALMYGAGMGVERDPLQQVLLYERACDGWSKACIVLGMLYDAGLGGPKDSTRARALYQRACDRKEEIGCKLLTFPPGSITAQHLAAMVPGMKLPTGALQGSADGTQPASPAPAPPAADDDDYKPPFIGEPLSLPGSITFDKNKATFSKTGDSTATLIRLANFLKQNAAITKLRIDGHTDNSADAKTSLSLSGKRALAVKKTLIDQGISPDRLLAVGFGMAMPIASNSTAEGRVKNARVELHIVERGGRALLQDVLAKGKAFQ